MNVYLSSSWKNRDRVRSLAVGLRGAGHEVYDFTDPACRRSPEIPPEKFPEQFDPAVRPYGEYLRANPNWAEAVAGNRVAVERCDAVVLLLPCGVDATADWALGVGLGKATAVVGHPRAGDRSPSHLWADAFLLGDGDVPLWLDSVARTLPRWIQSSSGEPIPLPRFDNPAAVSVDETAWVLSGIQRFGARTLVDYDVAEHSVRVADLVADLGGTPYEVWYAVNHEGDESLLGFDPGSPVVAATPGLRLLKEAAHRAYCARRAMREEKPEIVRRADLVLLATECRDLMATPRLPWGLALPEPLPERVVPWGGARVDRAARFRRRWVDAARAVGFPAEEW